MKLTNVIDCKPYTKLSLEDDSVFIESLYDVEYHEGLGYLGASTGKFMEETKVLSATFEVIGENEAFITPIVEAAGTEGDGIEGSPNRYNTPVKVDSVTAVKGKAVPTTTEPTTTEPTTTEPTTTEPTTTEPTTTEAIKNGIVDGFYYVDGKIVKGAGLVKVGDDYYYITMSGAVYKGEISISQANTHGLKPAGRYKFGTDGKMIIETEVKNGIVDGFYYVDNVLMKGAGLIAIGKEYYYITMSGAVYKGSISVTEANAHGLMPAGSYQFGEDGKMIIEAKNGIINGLYYVNNVLTKGAGLVKVDNDYYYITMSGAVYKGSISVTEANAHGLLPAGSYQFGADGKMIVQTEPKNGVIDGFYYENNNIVKGAGLVRVDDDYYYITMSGAVRVGKMSVTEANAHGLLPAGTYVFGADGKMIIE